MKQPDLFRNLIEDIVASLPAEMRPGYYEKIERIFHSHGVREEDFQGPYYYGPWESPKPRVGGRR